MHQLRLKIPGGQLTAETPVGRRRRGHPRLPPVRRRADRRAAARVPAALPRQPRQLGPRRCSIRIAAAPGRRSCSNTRGVGSSSGGPVPRQRRRHGAPTSCSSSMRLGSTRARSARLLARRLRRPGAGPRPPASHPPDTTRRHWPEGAPRIHRWREDIAAAARGESGPENLLYIMFAPTETSQEKGREFLGRFLQRHDPPRRTDQRRRPRRSVRRDRQIGRSRPRRAPAIDRNPRARRWSSRATTI